MSRYLVIDWELQSVWFTNNLSEIDEGGSCRYGDVVDMIRGVQSVLASKELKALKESADEAAEAAGANERKCFFAGGKPAVYPRGISFANRETGAKRWLIFKLKT